MFSLYALIHHPINSGRCQQVGGFLVFNLWLHPENLGLSGTVLRGRAV